MSYPTLRLPILRQWSSAPGITAGLRRMLEEEPVLVLPASLSEAEQGEIVDLLVLYLDMPARVVAHPEEARRDELSILAFPVDRAPPGVDKGVLVCFKRRAHTTRQLEITDKIIALRDAVIQSIGKQYEGTRLMIVARWALEAADSPGTALSFAAGAFAAHLDDPTISDPALYAAGLAGAIGALLRGVDLRVAEWMVAFATGAPYPGRLVSNEAQLLGENTAILRGLDAGLVLLAPEEPGDSLELRRPLETLRHLDTLRVTLTLADVAKPLAATLDPQVRLVLDRLLRPERKRLGLEGPRPVAGLLGREEVIARLVTLFDPANTIRTTVLYGVAGVGKRQVAAAVCDAMAGRFEPVWVRFAEGPEAGWMRVASALGVDTNRADAVALDREGVPRWVRQVHDGLRFLPCLLVVEGVDGMREDDLAKWLPTGTGTSAVLVLSRSAQRPLQRAHEAIAVRLEGHAVEAARRILAAHAPQLTDAILRGEADKLIDHVGGNATALALAGALLEHKPLLEVTSAVRRGEEGIPAVLREVIDGLPEGEVLLLEALAVCHPLGSLPDLAFLMLRRDDGREALDRLVDRAMVVGGGRTVRLVEVVRLEGERRLDRKPAVRTALERKHARAVDEMFGEAREKEDLTTREDLYADLVLAAERATAMCKGGERGLAETVAGLAFELTYYPGGDAGNNARLAVEAYQIALAVEPDNKDRQRELAVAHENMGNSLLERGDTMSALVAYRASLALRERLTQQDSTDRQWQRDVWVSHNKIGDVLLAQGDKDGALTAYGASLTIAERLAKQDPTNTEWQRDVSVSHGKIGNVLLAQGDKEGALVAYRAALAIAERLTQQDHTNTEWQRDVSVSHSKIGDVLLDQGDKEGALVAYRAALTIAERLALKDPANAACQRDLSVSHDRIGQVLFAQGDKEGALASCRAALTIAERLALKDPANAACQRDLSVSHNNIGQVLLSQEDKAGALAAYQASLAIRERLARQDPANAQWQTDLAFSCWALATALPTGTPAERAEARAYLERARRILGDLAAASRLTHAQQAWLRKIEASLRALPP